MTKIVAIMMDICSELLQLVPVLLELGSISLNLGLAGSAGLVCGELLFVLLDLLLGCLQLLFVLFDVLFIGLNVLFECVWIRCRAGRGWRTGLGKGCGAKSQGRCQNQVKSFIHCCLFPPRQSSPISRS